MFKFHKLLNFKFYKKESTTEDGLVVSRQRTDFIHHNKLCEID